MDSQISVVVLMSSYNGELYIREQIDSILMQQVNADVQLIIRDDGSTDRTKQILDEYAEQNRIIWYAGDNVGPAKSFIHLLENCGHYDFYSFADQDDYWLPDKLQNALCCISMYSERALFCSNAELVGSDLHSLGRVVYKTNPAIDFETVSCAGGLLGCTMVINDSLAQMVRRKPVGDNVIMHDFYIVMVCLALSGVVHYDSTPSMKYRQHDNNAIGVSHGLFHILKDRFKSIAFSSKVSIAEQAMLLLQQHGEQIVEDKRLWLMTISCYRKNALSRIRLAISRKTKYANVNMGLKLRLTILLGNR